MQTTFDIYNKQRASFTIKQKPKHILKRQNGYVNLLEALHSAPKK